MNTSTSTVDFKCLFESAPGLFLVLAPEHKFTILAVSDAYLRATLTQRDSIIDKGLFEIFPDNPDDPNATGTSNLRASLERVLSTRAPDAMAVQKYDIRNRDGNFEERFWSPINCPVFSPTNPKKIIYIIHRVEDVTEFVRVSQKGQDLERSNEEMRMEVLNRSRDLASANERLREADRAKSLFFNNISHEFRTPLTLLLGPIEALLSDPQLALPPKPREALRLAYRNALRLYKLVNSLLDFSRIESGRVRASFSPIDLSTLTIELASMFQSAFDKADLRLDIQCPPLSEVGYVDLEMWEKIVLNLVSNAFKFTFKGGVKISLIEKGAHFVLSVSDTGTGIPENELPHLFERFHRVSGAKSRSYEGTGIGLSLVRELVHIHKGEISVQSTLNQGTTFSITLPKGKSHLPAEMVSQKSLPFDKKGASFYLEEASQWISPEAPEKTETTSAASSARILVVDDNVGLRAYIHSILHSHYVIEAAIDGMQAIEKVKNQKPDLILSDVMMPNMDGFELLRIMRSDPETATIPFILLSARAGEESAVEGLEAGADDYLVKPFSAKELLARVRTHLQMASLRNKWSRELEQSNKELEAFNYAISHDLKAPLRAITGFGEILIIEHAHQLGEEGLKSLRRLQAAAKRMTQMIESLLGLSSTSKKPIHRDLVDLSKISREILSDLKRTNPQRSVESSVTDLMIAKGDPHLLQIVLQNLLGNAWKFTGGRAKALIEVGRMEKNSKTVFYVRDNGAGFDMGSSKKLFNPFSRLHSDSEFEGTGVGLATVSRIILRHGGEIWAEAAPNAGATFYFTLG